MDIIKIGDIVMGVVTVIFISAVYLGAAWVLWFKAYKEEGEISKPGAILGVVFILSMFWLTIDTYLYFSSHY